jgi:hypothetical protein
MKEEDVMKLINPRILENLRRMPVIEHQKAGLVKSKKFK